MCVLVQLAGAWRLSHLVVSRSTVSASDPTLQHEENKREGGFGQKIISVHFQLTAWKNAVRPSPKNFNLKYSCNGKGSPFFPPPHLGPSIILEPVVMQR